MIKRRICFLAVLAVLGIGGTACNEAGEEEKGKDQEAVIVIGDSVDESLTQTLQTAMGEDTKVLTDEEEPGGQYEILLGDTSREQSQRLSPGLREDDGWVRFYEDCVVIQGGSSEKLSEAVTWFVENAVPVYQAEGSFPDTAASDYVSYGMYVLQSLKIDGSDIFEYSIVTADGEETKDALFLQRHIAAMSQYTLPIIAPEELSDGQKAIIFGSSGAREADSLCAALADKEFLAKAEGDSLYLCAWDEAEERMAVRMFLGETLGCQFYTDTPSSANIALEDYSFKFTTAFDGSGKFKAMLSQVGRLDGIDEFGIMQGGCTDGTYAYYILEDQQLGSGNCLIVKMDVDTWEILAVSDPLPLDHGNGITYVPSREQFLVANCQPDPTLATWVDAKTLQAAGTERLDYTAYALSYNESRNMYAAYGLNKVMLMTDENLDVIRSYNGLASSYTTQGYDCDDDYVYIVSCTSNYIHVCDWEGHWIETIPIGIGSEMENMISFGDVHYTTFLNAGADIYETIFYRELYQ